MKTEYRLYNRLNCSFFDLISGEQEPKQTKALGLLLSRSSLALDKFLELIYPTDKQLRNKLQKCRCIIDCEARQSVETISQKSYRTDIILRFYERNIIPFVAIVIEAKSISVKINAENIVKQINNYKDTFDILTGFNKIDLVTITKYTTPISSVLNIRCITWNDILNKLSDCAKDNTIINDFCSFLFKIKGAMKFYEEDVLSIPAGDSIDSVETCGIYECPNNKKYQKYHKKVLYFSFRAKSGGVSRKLYKVKDILPITLGDNDAIKALNSIDSEYENRLRRYIQDRQNAQGIDMEEEKLVFFFDIEESITLPYPVKPINNNTFTKCYNLSRFFETPNKDGYIIL